MATMTASLPASLASSAAAAPRAASQIRSVSAVRGAGLIPLRPVRGRAAPRFAVRAAQTLPDWEDSDSVNVTVEQGPAASSNSNNKNNSQTAALAPLAAADQVYKPGERLGGKYTVVEVLRRTPTGVTYKARRPGGGYVSVRAVSLRSMRGNWQELERLESEAQALRQLSHPGIPKYLEFFEVDTDSDRGFFLVQELAEGKSLSELLERGWTPSRKEITNIAKQLLTTLAYLKSQDATHGAISPDSIILKGGKPTGQVLLTEFGAAAAASSDQAGLGSFGVFSAPEQLAGEGRPESDVYSVGATLLYMLTGQTPSDFPKRWGRLLFKDAPAVSSSPFMQELLNAMLQNRWQRRASPERLLQYLDQAPAGATAASASADYQQQQQQQPKELADVMQDVQTGARNLWDQAQKTMSGAAASTSRQQDTPAAPAPRMRRRGRSGPSPAAAAFLGLAAASVFAGPFFPIVALTLPFWLGALSNNTNDREEQDEERATVNPRYNSQQQQQQRGWGFSGPADADAEDVQMRGQRGAQRRLSPEQVAALRRQQQMAAWQQQMMLFNMMRMLGGGFGGPMGMGMRRRGMHMRGPFMF